MECIACTVGLMVVRSWNQRFYGKDGIILLMVISFLYEERGFINVLLNRVPVLSLNIHLATQIPDFHREIIIIIQSRLAKLIHCQGGELI